MIGISFGKWDEAYGRFLFKERLYRCSDYKWTPFIKISLRYLKTMREISEMEVNQPNFPTGHTFGQTLYSGTAGSEMITAATKSQ